MRFNEPILKALSTGLKARVVSHFLGGPPRMSEREIAKELKVSHMTVNRVVNELYAMNFLKVARAGTVNLWELNSGSFSAGALSAVMSASKSAVNPLLELKKVILKGLKDCGVNGAFIYGSIAPGTEKPESDIDLLVVVNTLKDRKRIGPALEKLEMQCLKLFGNPLSVHLLDKAEFEAKKGLEVIKAAQKGIKII